MTRLTQHEYARFFELLDGHSRDRHRCFLSEMSPSESGAEYVLCFRPVGAPVDAPRRYDCRYLRLETEEIRAASEMCALPPFGIQLLECELAGLEWTDPES